MCLVRLAGLRLKWFCQGLVRLADLHLVWFCQGLVRLADLHLKWFCQGLVRLAGLCLSGFCINVCKGSSYKEALCQRYITDTVEVSRPPLKVVFASMYAGLELPSRSHLICFCCTVQMCQPPSVCEGGSSPPPRGG